MAQQVSSELLQMLLETMPETIYFKDAAGRFTLVSQSLCRFYEVDDPSQVIGKTDFDFYPAEDAAVYQRDELQIMADGQPLIGKEEKCVTPNGELRYFLTTKIPLRDATG